ncbi:MAG: universal stress protein [Acidobacteria bacterium]|nr:MAG: universal stress protein [Acidobacteriota bacterium]
MFQHILIPLDFTDKNDAALAIAERLAAPDASRVTLLHVIEPLAGPQDQEALDFYRKLEHRAQRQLERQQGLFARQGIACETAVRRGRRAEEIVRWAVEHDVDLIVLSSHPLDPQQRPSRPWPTISHQVAILSPKPVLLVR